MAKSGKVDLKFLIETCVSYAGQEIPNNLTDLLKRMEAQPRINEVAEDIVQSGKLYAVRVESNPADKPPHVIQYSIGYFNKRPNCGKSRCTISTRFEPQLLFSYAYIENDIENKDFVFVSLLSPKSEGLHVNCINREIKKSSYSLLEIDPKDVREIYTEAKKKNFLELI